MILRAPFSLFLVLFTAHLFAQGNRPWDQRGGNTSSQALAFDSTLTRVDVEYATLGDVDKVDQKRDSTLEDFHLYDPTDTSSIPWVNLGNHGSPHKPLRLDLVRHDFIDAGIHQYRHYQFHHDDVKLYRHDGVFSDLFFSNIGGSQNFFVGAEFGKKFGDDHQFSLSFRRIAQTGLYQSQNVRHTQLSMNYAMGKPSNQHYSIVYFLNNVMSHGDNGGVADLSQLTNPQFNNRGTVDVNLSEASTRNQDRTYGYHHYYRFTQQGKPWQWRLHGHLSLGGGYFRFQDKGVGLREREFYDTLLVDVRGVRLDMDINRQELDIILQALKDESLLFDVGMRYQHSTFDFNPRRFGFHDILIGGEIVLPWKQHSLRNHAWFGIGDAAGTFDLKSTLMVQGSGWIRVQPNVNFYRRRPDILAQYAVSTQIPIYENEWQNRIGSELGLRLEVPKWEIGVEVKQSLEQNAIYFDTLALPRQLDGTFSALSITGDIAFDWKFIGMKHSAMWQSVNEDIFRLPSWATRHQLWIQGRLFKKVMEYHLGLDATLIPSYTGAAYMPLIGQFHQSNAVLPNVPNVDAYFTAKISAFRVFLRFENIWNYFSDQLPIHVANHPQNDVRFRLGVRWLLYN